MAQNRRFFTVLFSGVALAGIISFKQVNASPVSDLTSVFGTPESFVTNFKATVKDKSDQVIGLLIAASGFVYAIKVFTN
jgi:hypothetical protein